jgi:hypothetical protein
MKKIILSMSLFALVMASCSKEQTCVCTTTYTNSSGSTTTDPITRVYTKISNKDMKNVCQNTTSVSTTTSNSVTLTSTDATNCTIK